MNCYRIIIYQRPKGCLRLDADATRVTYHVIAADAQQAVDVALTRFEEIDFDAPEEGLGPPMVRECVEVAIGVIVDPALALSI